MEQTKFTTRRTVLRTLGAGVVGAATLTGSASAGGGNGNGNGNKGAYGNGNGLGAFLNEEAEFKESPIWDGEIADRRGQDVVDVAVGAMTPISVPDPSFPPEGPVAFDPHVVKVSPGATVRWTWVSNPLGIPVPHDVTSLVDDDGNVVLERHAGQRYHHHDKYTPVPDGEDVNPTFEFTFEERGNHLYYCTPHGSTFTVYDPELEMNVFNAFGMRGAVKVAGRALPD